MENRETNKRFGQTTGIIMKQPMIKSILLYLSLFFNGLVLFGCIYVCYVRTDYLYRINAYINRPPKIPAGYDNECVASWNNCIEKLHIQTDVVFFGNSITAMGDFQDAFPNVKSINMGYMGDDTKGMLRRVDAIKSVQPKKVFLMAGINGLMEQTDEDFERRYATLVDSIQRAVPDAQLFLESILPIRSLYYESDNAHICKANAIIRKIAEARGLEYIDLYSLYVKDGALSGDMTRDGIHLTDEAYTIWYEAIEFMINQ